MSIETQTRTKRKKKKGKINNQFDDLLFWAHICHYQVPVLSNLIEFWSKGGNFFFFLLFGILGLSLMEVFVVRDLVLGFGERRQVVEAELEFVLGLLDLMSV